MTITFEILQDRLLKVLGEAEVKVGSKQGKLMEWWLDTTASLLLLGIKMMIVLIVKRLSWSFVTIVNID